MQLPVRGDVRGAQKDLHHENGAEGALGLRPAGVENDLLHGSEHGEADPPEEDRPLPGAGRMILHQPVRDLVAPPGPVVPRVEPGQGAGGAEAAILPVLGIQQRP